MSVLTNLLKYEDYYARIAFEARGESVNAWITTLLDRETTRVLEEQGLAG